MRTVDLNADMGEGFGAYRIGDDAGMLDIVTSANVACGAHAGDPEIMARTFALARERGVAVGAHPGFPDLWGFGRRRMPFSTGEIERLVAYQVGAAAALAAYAGHRITYVKAHGALSNMAGTDPNIAKAIAAAVKAVDRQLALLAIALTPQVEAGERAGLAVYQEVFADRGYDDDGQLIARDLDGAMLTDADAAARRVVTMVRDGVIVCASGKRLPTAIHSVCIHGDSAHAVGMARQVRAVLAATGTLTLAPFAPAALAPGPAEAG